MIVVHIPSWFPEAGKPLNGNFILRQMEAAGRYSEAILLRHVSPNIEYPIPENVHFHPIYGAQKRRLFSLYISEFQNIIKKYGKPDAIHLHVALSLGPIAAFLSRKFHIPLVISEHWSIYQPMNRSQLKPLQRWELRYMYKTAAHITAVSQNLLNSITATVPVAAYKPQSVVGNVVNPDIFSLKPALQTHPKKQILHVSTLDNDAKNIMGILRAVDALSQQRNDFELHIVHDFRNILAETFVRERGLTSVVHFLGQKTSQEIASLLQNSDFFLLFSNYENQPCVLLESFCTGTPVVTTPVGGIPEIAHADNSVIVTPRDEAQLIEKLNFMLDHADQFQPEIIRNQAMDICSPEIIGKKWADIYRSM